MMTSFFKSYTDVMKTVAVVMKFLEGEDDCYTEHKIPTILGI